jgi:hypothetical protein
MDQNLRNGHKKHNFNVKEQFFKSFRFPYNIICTKNFQNQPSAHQNSIISVKTSVLTKNASGCYKFFDVLYSAFFIVFLIVYVYVQAYTPADSIREIKKWTIFFGGHPKQQKRTPLDTYLEPVF